MFLNTVEYFSQLFIYFLSDFFLLSRLMVLILFLFNKLSYFIKNVVLKIRLITMFLEAQSRSLNNWMMRSVAYWIIHRIQPFRFHCTFFLSHFRLVFHSWSLIVFWALNRSHFLIFLLDLAHGFLLTTWSWVDLYLHWLDNIDLS